MDLMNLGMILLAALGVSGAIAFTRKAKASPHASLGLALLSEAQADLDKGVREVGGKNRGPEVDAYLKSVGINLPKDESADGSSWCAAALTVWLRRAAAKMGVPSPIDGSASSKTIMSQLKAKGKWHTAIQAQKLAQPGWIVVWDRSVLNDPSTSWQGHIGVIKFTAPTSSQLTSIDGNSGTGPLGEGNRVAEMIRNWNDPRLLGAGPVD